jgi:peroxiredoxin
VGVVYFYPADDTPGCTAESCSFRDSHEDFVDAGAVVIGISGDSVESHKRFADKHNLPFTLLADADGAARGSWGVGKTLGLLPGRVTYVIDPEGVVRKVFSSQFRPRSTSTRRCPLSRGHDTRRGGGCRRRRHHACARGGRAAVWATRCCTSTVMPSPAGPPCATSAWCG